MTPLISLWLVAWGRSEVMPIDLSKTGSLPSGRVESQCEEHGDLTSPSKPGRRYLGIAAMPGKID
ncbi:MAG: hypothetical protein M1415_04650, partial [Firmicutes bacterium]|nr:hypothetical protein [Bacillota bacterium]